LEKEGLQPLRAPAFAFNALAPKLHC